MRHWLRPKRRRKRWLLNFFQLKRLLFSSVVFVALIPNVAMAQAGVVKGTVVIVNQTKDELIMAADSIAVPEHGKPDYSYCKIATLKGNVLFAGLNGQVLAAKLEIRFPDGMDGRSRGMP